MSIIKYLSLFLLILLNSEIWAEQPTEVGSIAGSFDVSLSGSSVYSIPIRIAPGTAGTEPKISVTYDSQASSGPLGAGWSISGLSFITRGHKNFFTDHETSGINFDDSDALFMDGQRLIAITQVGIGKEKQVVYRKEVDDLTRIVQIGESLNSSIFTAQTKGGVKLEFSGSNGSHIKISDTKDEKILSFAVSRIIDSTGNYIEFHYNSTGKGNYDISSIRYTGHEGIPSTQPYASIDFEYEEIDRTLDSYIAGKLLRRNTRLKSITSRISNKSQDGVDEEPITVAHYVFDYEDRDTANRFVLTKIHQFGEDGAELTPTHFSYSEPKVGWTEAKYQIPIGAFANRENFAGAYHFTHFTNDVRNLPDLLFSAKINGNVEAHAYQNNGGIWRQVSNFNPPIAFISDDGSDLGALVVDLNGDGRSDLLQSYQNTGQAIESSAWLADNDKWQSTEKYKIQFPLSENGKKITITKFLKLTRGPGPDLIYAYKNKSGFLVNTADGWKESDLYAPKRPISEETRFIDVDCDGLPEIVETFSEDNKNIWKISRFDPIEGWKYITDAKLQIPFPLNVNPNAVSLIDLNQDSCDDIIVSDNSNGHFRKSYLASTSGWTINNEKNPEFSLVNDKNISADALVIDIDKDGKKDVVAHKVLPDGEIISFAYRQTESGWEDVTSKWNIPVLSKKKDGDSIAHTVLVDIDGDGFVDIIQSSGSLKNFGSIYAGTGKGFIEKNQFAPPVAVTAKSLQNRGIRLIDLDADGLLDIVYRRDEMKDGKVISKTGAFKNTGRGWVNEPFEGLELPEPLASENIKHSPAEFADIDGDGYVDLLYSYRDRTGHQNRSYYRNEEVNGKRKWVKQENSGFIPPQDITFSAEITGDLGVRFADLNGDGRVDLLSGFLPSSGTDKDSQEIEICETDPQTGEINCQLNRSFFKVAAYINDGKSWRLEPNFVPPLPFVFSSGISNSTDLNVQIIDIDGDRLPDIVGSFKHPYDETKEVREVWRNTGSGWVKIPDFKIPILLDEQNRDRKLQIHWVDINGDGLTDLLTSSKAGNINKSKTWLSTGQGFVVNDKWQIPIKAISNNRFGDTSYRLIDVNGDGFIDILYSRLAENNSAEKGLFVNTGSEWKEKDASLVGELPSFADNSGEDLGVRIFDVDGNGLPDIIKSYASGTADSVAEKQIFLNSARRSDVLETIDSGYGLKTSITYQTLLEGNTDWLEEGILSIAAWPRVYEPGKPDAFPIISPVPAMFVVRRVQVDEGNSRSVGISYRYGNYRMHADAMRPLGFGWREALNEVTKIVSRSELIQDIKIGNRIKYEARCWIKEQMSSLVELPNLCPLELSVTSNSIVKLYETQNEWKVFEGVSGGAGLPQKLIRQVTLDKTKHSTYELDGLRTSTQTNSFVYDELPNILDRHLNVLETRTEREDGTTVHTINEYREDNPEKWFLGRLTKSTITKWGDKISDGSTERKKDTRIVGFSYDKTTGLLSSETINLESSSWIRTEYLRDSFGNIKRTKISTTGLPERESISEFDQIGRFKLSETNALGHKSEIKPKLTTGMPYEITDANSLTATFVYDGFGRTRKIKSPTDVTTYIDYLHIDQLSTKFLTENPTWAYAISKRIDDRPPVIQIFDNKGRIVREISNGFTQDPKAGRFIFQDYQFDLMGRLIQSSLPYDVGEKIKWNTTTYDVVNRVIESVTPEGAKTKVAFSGRSMGGYKTTIINHFGNQTVTEFNSRNLVTSVTDAKKGRSSFAYDGGDRLQSVISPMGAITKYEYDAIGRLKRSTDPDLGVWLYEYNNFNELTRKVDAKSQVFEYEYDLLGRLKKYLDSGTVDYLYDSAEHGIGKLAKISGSDGYIQEFNYDNFSRLHRIHENLAENQITTRYDYDQYGRIANVFYPTNNLTDAVVLKNVYDIKGYLTDIKTLDGSTTLWRAKARDNFGRLTDQVYGNGANTVTEYYPESGRTKKIKVVSGKNKSLLDLNLEYDILGNLKVRNDQVDAIIGKYGYDELNRLISTNESNVTKFDADGRVISKKGIGEYIYPDTAKNRIPPNQVVKAFHGVHAIKNNSGVETFNYDANGNLKDASGISFGYTDDNRLNYIYKDRNDSTRFYYSPSGNRYLQVTRDKTGETQIAYSNIYEQHKRSVGLVGERPKPKLERHRYYVSNGEGVFATIESNIHFLDPVDEGLPSDSGGIEKKNKVWYLHRDQLGSIVRITDEEGLLTGKLWFDAWGAKTVEVINDSPKVPLGGKLLNSWSRGFTGHEHLDQYALIHMNGRVYDPKLGMFTSPDPVALNYLNTQALGRYQYAFNNPLRYIDPTGYWSWDGALKGAVVGFVMGGPGGAATGFVIGGNDDSRRFVEENWRPIVIVAAAIYTGGAAASAAGAAGYTAGEAAILAGMAAGATSGALSSSLYGGDFHETLQSAAFGAFMGGWSAGAFYGVGSIFSAEAGAAAAPGTYASDSLGAIAAHGAVGGITETAQGGDFWQGFASGAFTKASSVYSPFSSYGANVTRAAIVGGTVSVISKGKFANGALIGAFSYIFNDSLHYNGKKLFWNNDQGETLESWDATSGKNGSTKNDQAIANFGPIPSGEYMVLQTNYEEWNAITLLDKAAAFIGRGSWPGGTTAWGEQRVWLKPAPGTHTFGRSGLSIHGGSSPGSKGCIDLCNNMPAFSERFRKYGKDINLHVEY